MDEAIRPILLGSNLPLILAAAEPLASIFRSVCSYTQLADEGLDGSPESLNDAELVERARKILDELYSKEIADWRTQFDARFGEGRATADFAQASRAAAAGAVDSLLVDIDEDAPGLVDDQGAVAFADQVGGATYSLASEISARVLATGGRVIGVRSSEIPGGGPVAAILRYPF